MLTNEEFIIVLTGIVLPSALMIFLMFIPSLIEWKKPRDSGPRLKPGFFKSRQVKQNSSLVTLDKDIGNQLLPNSTIFQAKISNIED